MTDTEALIAYFGFLIHRRLEEGMTQEDLSGPLGVSTATISVIKNGKQPGIRLDNAEQFARALAHKPLDEAIKAAREWVKARDAGAPIEPAAPTEPPPIILSKKPTKRIGGEIKADKEQARAKDKKRATR